jgi:hypothetical protein
MLLIVYFDSSNIVFEYIYCLPYLVKKTKRFVGVVVQLSAVGRYFDPRLCQTKDYIGLIFGITFRIKESEQRPIGWELV